MDMVSDRDYTFNTANAHRIHGFLESYSCYADSDLSPAHCLFINVSGTVSRRLTAYRMVSSLVPEEESEDQWSGKDPSSGENERLQQI